MLEDLIRIKKEIEELNEKRIRLEERIKTLTEELREKSKVQSTEKARRVISTLESEVKKKSRRIEKEANKLKKKYSL